MVPRSSLSRRRSSRAYDGGTGRFVALLAVLLLPNVPLYCLSLDVKIKEESHEGDAAKEVADDAPRLECGIWLALSSLPNTGMGMYAGKEYKHGQKLQSPLGDISIPVTDMKLHNSNPDFHYLWDSYVWGADPYNLVFTIDQEAPYVEFASPGYVLICDAVELRSIDFIHLVSLTFCGLSLTGPIEQIRILGQLLLAPPERRQRQSQVVGCRTAPIEGSRGRGTDALR